MSRVFQVKPKSTIRSNGTIVTPEMVVTITSERLFPNQLFLNDAKEIKDAYMRQYGNDYSKARWSSWDFEVKELGKC